MIETILLTLVWIFIGYTAFNFAWKNRTGWCKDGMLIDYISTLLTVVFFVVLGPIGICLVIIRGDLK